MNIYDKLPAGRQQVTGVGSALVDILARADDAFLEQVGALKGGMTYVDINFIDATLAKMPAPPQVVPGGSACNTVVGISRLGGRACFIGKCGNGAMGRLFCDDLEKQGVRAGLLRTDAPTGRVLSIITPDAQRSMFTFLGASAATAPHEIVPEQFADSAIVHIEGYLLFNRDLMTATLAAARAAGALISLDLASFNVVAEARDVLPDLVARYVDILLANEDEAEAYTGTRDPARAMQGLSRHVDLAVLKRGARGSLIAHRNEVLRVAAAGNGDAVDTTGAGDLYAAGLLYGLVRRMPLVQCGALAAACGYEVCQVVGAGIPDDRWQVIQRQMEA